jgi:hypothetical protein
VRFDELEGTVKEKCGNLDLAGYEGAGRIADFRALKIAIVESLTNCELMALLNKVKKGRILMKLDDHAREKNLECMEPNIKIDIGQDQDTETGVQYLSQIIVEENLEICENGLKYFLKKIQLRDTKNKIFIDRIVLESKDLFEAKN